MRYWIFTLLWSITACGSEDRPPLVSPKPDGGETGSGAEGGGGSSSGGSSARGGSTATGGNAGTGGSGNTGGLGRPDPEQLYILGTLEPRRSDVMALCHWSTPEDYAAGFADIDVYKATVGESGLIYQLASRRNEIRRFVPDLTSSEPLSSIVYPADPMDNDPIIAELECPPGGVVLDFVVGLGDTLAYFCTGAEQGWYAGGELLFEFEGQADMQSLGDGVAFFTESAGNYGAYVVNLESGEPIRVLEDVVGINVGSVSAARATRDGFLVATSKGVDPDGDDILEFVEEFWEVGNDGDTSLVGTYEPWIGTFPYQAKLDLDGDLYVLDQVNSSVEVELWRRTVGGGNEILYSDQEPANVFISGLALVTGP